MMRELLLGTTALVAVAATLPAMAAEPLQLSLRGYFVGAMAYTDVSGASGSDENRVNFGSDSEIHFIAATVLDNGIRVSFKAELELEDDPASGDSDADVIDEVYIQFDGGFGRIQFGQNDGAMDQTQFAGPRLFDRHHANDTSMDPFEAYGLENEINTFGEFSSDDIKLTYFTPRMNGVQLGFSYTPNPCKNGPWSGGYSACVFDEFARNYWEVAGTWKIDVNNIALGLSAGYGQGEQGATDQEPSELTLGFNVGFGGFTIGGSYANKETGGVNAEQDHWDLAGRYDTGPWSFGLQYATANGDMDWTGVEDEEYTSWLGGVRYMYGPGMHIGLGVQTLEFDDTGTADDDDGVAVFIENAIRF